LPTLLTGLTRGVTSTTICSAEHNASLLIARYTLEPRVARAVTREGVEKIGEKNF
jgi:hypothetical protein